MIKYLYTILKSNNPRLFYHKMLLIIAIVMIVYYLHKFSDPPKEARVEGFSQEAPFVLKMDLAIYDDFYAEVYDGITEREKTCQKELYEIVKMTELDTKNSTILDIGSGTGCTVNELSRAGYNAYGIDKSESMIQFSETKYPDAQFIRGDVADAMAFEKGLFTHILCTNFTIYEMPDKRLFFRNCYHWLKPNGYLVIHLADREKFSAKQFNDGVMDLGALYRSIIPKSKERRVTATVEFSDYVYESVYEVKTEAVVLKETFTDKETKHIRQNENMLRMSPIDDILKIAASSGFIIQGKTGCTGDENQFLYVLERTM